jgi:hypothetical protein
VTSSNKMGKVTMNSILHSVRNLISKPQQDNTSNEFKVLTTKKDILKAIIRAKDTQSVLGVYSPALGEGLFLTGVLILDTDHAEPIVTFNRYDLNRIYLNRTQLGISEIKGVCVFDHKYSNPLLQKVDPEQAVEDYSNSGAGATS